MASRILISGNGWHKLFIAIGLIACITAWAAASSAPPSTASSASRPLPDLKAMHQAYEASGFSQTQAEVAMCGALAAVYHQRDGKFLMLCDDHLEGVQQAASRFVRLDSSVSPLVAALKPTGSMTLEQFLSQVRHQMEEALGAQASPYIAKFPCRAPLQPVQQSGTQPPQMVRKAAENGVIFSENFENGLSNWNLWDNTYAAYAWSTASCDAHTGAYSGDAVRGGSMGSTLGCYDTYPQGVTTNMQDLGCEDLSGAGQAWFDGYVSINTDGSSGYPNVDTLALYYSGYGWLYWGAWPSWWHLIFNLRQWYGLGDLTQYSCNQLWLAFNSQYNTPPGFGARIDDITIQTSSAPGLGCSIGATPLIGFAPLTVAFSANTVGASGSQTYFWNFGDGMGDTSQAPLHIYTSAGDYWASLIVADGTNNCTSNVEISVQQGSCSLALSPASLPGGTVGSFYNQTISASGGAPPYTYAVTSGTVPIGLALSSSGLLSGSPAQAGSFAFTITATDTNGCTRNESYTITVVQTLSYSISGSVTTNGYGLQGVCLSDGSVAATTDSTGYFSLTGLANGTYTITPSLAGYTFYPTNQSVSVNGVAVNGLTFAATQSNYLPVHFFSQRDPQWACDHLGFCTTPSEPCTKGGPRSGYDTIYAQGCYITSIAMVIHGYSTKTNPSELNTQFKGDGGYTQKCLVNWGQLPEADMANVILTQHIGASTGNPRKDLAALSPQIDAELAKGYPVLAGVRFKKMGTYIRNDNTHMVVIIGKAAAQSGPSAYLILDPWDLQQPANPRTLNDGAINGKPYDLRSIYAVSSPYSEIEWHAGMNDARLENGR